LTEYLLLYEEILTPYNEWRDKPSPTGRHFSGQSTGQFLVSTTSSLVHFRWLTLKVIDFIDKNDSICFKQPPEETQKVAAKCRWLLNGGEISTQLKI